MDTTFPRLLLKHAAERPTAPAMREKEYGIWQTLTWSQLADMAQGLAALGVQVDRRDRPAGDGNAQDALRDTILNAYREFEAAVSAA